MLRKINPKLEEKHMNQFELSVLELEGERVINFANKSSDFVEVVFTIDGKEVKEGNKLTSGTKGYAYPPKLEKSVKKMKNGIPLQFGNYGGEVAAHIFSGEGEYKSEDLDKPAFLRNRLVSKIKFKRLSNEPLQTIKIKY